MMWRDNSSKLDSHYDMHIRHLTRSYGLHLAEEDTL